MDPIGAAIFFIAVAIVLGLGAYGYKVSKKTVADYAIAGGTMGYVVMAANAAATLVSTGTMMGFMGSFYLMGLPYFTYLMMPIIHMALLMLFIGSRFIAAREVYKVYSPLHALHIRYGSKTFTIVTAILWFVTCAIYAAMQITGVGRILVPILGIPFEWAAVIAAIIAFIYIYMGGYRAVAWTNVVWVILYFLGFWAPAIMLFTRFNIFELANKVDPRAFTLQGFVNYNVPLLLWTNLVNLWSALGFIWAFYSIMGSRSLRISKVAALFGWNNYVVLITPSLAIALIMGRALLPDLKVPDLVFYELTRLYAHPGLTIPYAVGVAAAGISTAAALAMLQGVVAESALHILGPAAKWSERTRINVTRLFIAVGLILGLVIAIVLKWPVGLIFSYALAFMGFTVPAMLGALFWKRATAKAALLSILCGVIVYLIGMYVPLPIPGPPPTRFIVPPNLLYGFTVAALVFFIAVPLTKHSPTERPEMPEKLAEWIRENA